VGGGGDGGVAGRVWGLAGNTCFADCCGELYVYGDGGWGWDVEFDAGGFGGAVMDDFTRL